MIGVLFISKHKGVSQIHIWVPVSGSSSAGSPFNFIQICFLGFMVFALLWHLDPPRHQGLIRQASSLIYDHARHNKFCCAILLTHAAVARAPGRVSPVPSGPRLRAPLIAKIPTGRTVSWCPIANRLRSHSLSNCPLRLHFNIAMGAGVRPRPRRGPWKPLLQVSVSGLVSARLRPCIRYCMVICAGPVLSVLRPFVA